ncbi:MAG: Indole-3-glycerol-phosphate synthase [Desulfomicrobiaceae bacterium]|jgi:indole-3-glycerol phosphate synthase|nr:Indole-3-glycerol-phosphate synthase [Desulfomicrobiaceae bacterium]
MLERFRAAKQAEIAALHAAEAAGTLAPLWAAARPSLAEAIATARATGRSAIIAEYKRASPSQGCIRTDLTAREVCNQYASAGACALSILTEERYFQGSLAFLHDAAPLGLPMLRKDFILHPLQVRATAATPASAVLLITRMLSDAVLTQCLEAAKRTGLEAVVEVFDRADLHRALAAQARIIQVNARDLDTLAVDLGRSRALAREKSPGQIWIAASGITCREDVLRLEDAGFDAALVGTSLMRAPDPGAALRQLLGEP